MLYRFQTLYVVRQKRQKAVVGWSRKKKYSRSEAGIQTGHLHNESLYRWAILAWT